MRYVALDENKKQRLVERFDIARAVDVFRERGCEEGELLEQLLALFYVDLDELDEVMRAA